MVTYRKGNKKLSFDIVGGKANITMEFGGMLVSNPSLEMLVADGWVEQIVDEVEYEPVVEQYIPTLEELVEQKIRERYSMNQEFEVQRKRDIDPEAFQVYYDFVENCIETTKIELKEKYGSL